MVRSRFESKPGSSFTELQGVLNTVELLKLTASVDMEAGDADVFENEIANLTERLGFVYSPWAIPSYTDMVYIADDFALTGKRSQGNHHNIFIKRPEFKSKTQTLLIACKKLSGIGKVFRYYGANRYTNPSGSNVSLGGVSITGTYCSTDFGYESVIEKFIEYLAIDDIQFHKPLPAKIRRPYERDRDRKFTNHEFIEMANYVPDLRIR